MKMEYRRHLDNGAAPWQLVTNIDELMWNGEYFIRVSNDNGSSKLPFPMSNDETATLVVKDYSHEGKLQRNRKIVQEISKVEQEGGKVLNYTRVYHEIYGTNRWGNWEQETNREGTSSGDNKEENKIQWTSSSYLDTYTTAGIYDITGERTNDADGLPLANAAPGHTFHARLLVLDSSIAGSGKDTDKCITQILSLSNRTGGDGNVYTRTGRAASKNLLAGGSGWGPWGKMQQNVEVGQVTSLDSFTDNGIYSGVYTGGDNNAETFVMVVINNYAVAAETGNIRSISQYKHALNIDGTFSQMVRTGQGNTGISWGAWTDFSAAGIQDGAITAQKLATEVRDEIANLQLNNMSCASRASISYNNSTGTLDIGTGAMYFYNGKSRQIYFNNTSSYTYTFTGSRVIVFDTVNSVITDKSPEGTLATDIWLLWYDSNAIKGGMLYKYVNNADLTKKIRYNNMEVVSRAAVSYNSSTKTISIGSGKIFCYNSNTRVEINLTTPYEYTFTGSATIVYNTVDKTIIKRDPTAVNDYDIVLLWYDGTKGLHAGLLYRYVKEEADNAKEQNPPLDKKISAGAVILDNLVVGVPVYIQVRLTGTNCGIGVYDADGNRKKFLKNRTAGKAGEVESVLYVIEEGDAKIKELGWSSLYLDYVLYLDASSYTTREGVVNQEKYINTQIAASLDTPIKSIIHGGTGSYPQNNLVLYKNAAQKGMLFWECDVRPCADGYVLSHDDDMYQLALDADGNQLTQGDWLCSQKTVAELKTLRTGIKKGVYSIVKGYENATVATLEEFIVLAKVYGACPVIEIKFTATEAQIREIYSIVKRHGMVGRSLFLVYANRALHGQYFHAIDENANLVFCGEGSIAASDLDAIISYKNDRNVMGLSYFIEAYTDEVLNKALDEGLLIGTWSATSSSNIVSLVNKGFSMFTIDDMNKNSVTTLRDLV